MAVGLKHVHLADALLVGFLTPGCPAGEACLLRQVALQVMPSAQLGSQRLSRLSATVSFLGQVHCNAQICHPYLLQIEQLVTLTEAARSHKTLWQHEPSRVQEGLRSALADLGTSVSSSRLQQYVHSSLGRLVVMANSLEGTLPQGITTSQTLSQMEAMATNPPADLHTPAKFVWDAEGGKSGAAGKQQMEQGMKAVLYLQRTLLEPFGRQLVLEAYNNLMQGKCELLCMAV